MNVVDKAIETQLKNIQAKTGKTLDELRAVIQQSALTKHGQIRAMFQRDLGLGYGDANMLAQVLRDTAGERLTAAPAAPPDELANILYAGAKAALRPIHDQLMAGIEQLGAYEIAPKKGYLSLRRSKQFAMIGPATNTRVEVGLNMKGGAATERLVEMPSGSMCNYKVKLTDVAEVDAELMAWIKRAYESAG
ncbi:MAG: DUF5655 domain-containing protein [Chloroflexota bacterium]|nr:DUF5655 domain-containing protein [Chloroflexota bacterium]